MPSDRRGSAPPPADGLAQAWLDVPDPIDPSEREARPLVSPPAGASLTRAQARVRRAIAFAACLLWLGGMIVLWGLRDVADGGHVLVGQAVVLLVFIVVIFAAALARGRRGLGLAARPVTLLAFCAPLLFVLVTLPSSQPGVGSLARLLRCFGLGLFTMAPMVALLIGSARASFAAGARWRGAALGAGCGLGAALFLTLHCEIPFGGHVAIAHGLPIVLAGAAGAWLGEKIARA